MRNQQGTFTGRPSKMFVYLPVYLKNSFQKIVIQDRMPFTVRIEVGDSFVLTKRDNPRDFLDDMDDLKVEKVKYNYIDGSCIVILEKKVFTEKEKLSEFLKNKRSV